MDAQKTDLIHIWSVHRILRPQSHLSSTFYQGPLITTIKTSEKKIQKSEIDVLEEMVVPSGPPCVSATQCSPLPSISGPLTEKVTVTVTKVRTECTTEVQLREHRKHRVYKQSSHEKVNPLIEFVKSGNDHHIYRCEKHVMKICWGGPDRTGIGTPRLEQSQVSQVEEGNDHHLFEWHLIRLRKTNDFQVSVRV